MGHMARHAREALALAGSRSRRDLDADRMFELALTRLLEIIGEAASRVPLDVRDRYPGVPWRDVIDCRNRLIHGYDTLDLDIVWAIVANDLPQLLEALPPDGD